MEEGRGHGVQRDEDIKVLLGSGLAVSAKLAGRDPSTDIAVLRIDGGSSGAPQLGDSTSLRLGHLVLALGRTRRGDLVASSGIVGALAASGGTGVAASICESSPGYISAPNGHSPGARLLSGDC